MHALHTIQRILALIEQRLTSPLPLEKLAQQARMSRWHFQRTFAAVVGEPAGSYIRRRRLTAAGQRLRSTRESILEVALEFQFESHEAFTRAFKAEMQATPSHWRAAPTTPSGGREPFTLSLREFRQRYQHMKLVPEIVTLPARSFTGLQARFISALSTEANNLQVIPKLWADFVPRIADAKPLEGGITYGLCECPESIGEKSSRPDEALYLAAIESRPDAKPPRGMTTWKSPGGTFAKFIHRGPVSRLGQTMGYIYAQWLPNGDYESGDGPDIERCDERFNPMSEDSVLEIFIPVRKKPAGAKSA